VRPGAARQNLGKFTEVIPVLHHMSAQASHHHQELSPPVSTGTNASRFRLRGWAAEQRLLSTKLDILHVFGMAGVFKAIWGMLVDVLLFWQIVSFVALTSDMKLTLVHRGSSDG
jgi:hypothetical protein